MEQINGLDLVVPGPAFNFPYNFLSGQDRSYMTLEMELFQDLEAEKFDMFLYQLRQADASILRVAASAAEALLKVRCKLRGDQKLVDLFDKMLSIISSNKSIKHYRMYAKCVIIKMIKQFQRFPDAVLFKSLLSSDFIQSSDVFKKGCLLGMMVDAIVQKDSEIKQGSEVAATDALEARKCFYLCVQAGLNIQSREKISHDGEDLEQVLKQEVAPLEKCVRHKLYNEAKLLYETGLYSSRYLPPLPDQFLHGSEKKNDESAKGSEDRTKDLMSVILFQPCSLQLQCCVTAIRYSKDVKDRRRWAEEQGLPHPLIDEITFRDALSNYVVSVQKEEDARREDER